MAPKLEQQLSRMGWVVLALWIVSAVMSSATFGFTLWQSCG
jgi:hypothetical protein